MDKKHEVTSATRMRSKSNVKNEKLTELAGKIEETDEMKLKMLAEQACGKPEPEDALYPPELNEHLIEQLKIMTCENNELRKLVFTRDEEIKQLNKTVFELNQRIRDIISGTGPTISSKSAGIISAKITELCKQNRHLVAEVEGYKTKNAALERKIMQLDIMNKEQEKLDVCMCKDDPTINLANPDELKELNIKLSVVNKRLAESKNRNLELKNEILIATKILQQELGDKFTSIKELQNDLAGWKGRAQQIILLQNRVSELEDKLNGKQQKEPSDPNRENQGVFIRDIEAKRRREVDQVLKDFDSLKDENHDIKKKLDAAKCRIRNLECDSLTIRQKMQTLIEKSNHDDLLINEQRNQIKNLELYYQEILKENTVKMNKMHAEIQEYQKVNKNTDAKIDALRKQATEKAAKIEELRVQLLRYEECSLQSVFFTPMKTATDNEIQKLSQLVITLNERLDAERRQMDELDTAHRKLKQKKKRLEKKVAQMEEEARIQLARTAFKQSRMSIQRDHMDVGAVSSIMKKKSSMSTVPGKQSESSSTESQPPEIAESLDKDELKYKLELTEEKLKILEDKLKMVEEEKSEDYNNLTDMIQNSKQLFNEALTVLQKEKCLCS